MCRVFVVAALLVVAAGVSAAPNPANIGEAQFACAFEAALTILENRGTLNSLYQQHFSSLPPTGFTTCSTTFASCDTTYGSTPKPCGTLERVFNQGYILTGGFVAAPAINSITTLSGLPGGNATGYLSFLAPAIMREITTHYKGAAATPPIVYWNAYPFGSPWNDNIQYHLNRRTVDWSLGQTSNGGTFLVEPPNPPVNRTSLIQFPTCPYMADTDGILQGLRALPSGIEGPLNITNLASSAAANVIVCCQQGTNFDTGFNTRAAFQATKVTRASLAECIAATSDGTVHATYSLKSALQVAYESNSTYLLPAVAIVPVGAKTSLLYAMFRQDAGDMAQACVNGATGAAQPAVIVAAAAALVAMLFARA